MSNSPFERGITRRSERFPLLKLGRVGSSINPSIHRGVPKVPWRQTVSTVSQRGRSGVYPFLLALLASSHLGDPESRADVGRGHRHQGFQLPVPLCRIQRHLYEGQLCQSGACACFDRLAHPVFHRGSTEALKRSFFPLDQSKPSAAGQVFLGTRLFLPTEWSAISLLRRSIIKRKHFWKSMRIWSSDTGCDGSKRKPLKRLVTLCPRHNPSMNRWVNWGGPRL